MATVTNAQIKAIPGWFGGLDVPAFRLLLAETAVRLGGDLAELGVYQGKSAVLLGAYLNSGETLTVVDLFGTEASADGNKRENAEQYPNLTRAQFEHAYQRVHGNLPVVIEGYSSSITQYAAAAAHRLVHVDASHLYEHVVTDIESARTLLKPDGIAVFDDYRSGHTPGVAAAVWQAAGGGMRPFLLTPQKLYATWGDPSLWRELVHTWAQANLVDSYELQTIGGNEVVRVWSKLNPIVRHLPPSTIPALRRVRALWT